MGHEDRIRRYIEALGGTATYALPGGIGEVLSVLPYIPCISLLVLRVEAQTKYNDLVMQRADAEAIKKAAEVLTEISKAYAGNCSK